MFISKYDLFSLLYHLDSALKIFGRARAQPENLRSRRAQTVLSAAQFCAHFKNLETFQSTFEYSHLSK